MERTRGDDAMEGTGLTKHLGGIALAAVLALGLTALPAQADTIRVPQDEPTIQDGVDTAVDGDTVLVKKGGGSGTNGDYLENVLIKGKSITLKCKNGAVIDAGQTKATISGTDYSAGVTVEEDVDGDTDGTRIEGCTIKNAQNCDSSLDESEPVCSNNFDDGDGIDVGGSHVDGVEIVRNTFIGNERAGLWLVGDECLISRNTALDNKEIGIFAECDNSIASIDRNKVQGSSKDGLLVEGDNNTVDRNTAENNKKRGIKVEGDDNEVTNNLASTNGENNIEVNGDRNKISRNVALHGGKEGFKIDGDEVTVERNLSLGNAKRGYRLKDTGSSGWIIDRNRASNNGEHGVELLGLFQGEFTRNRLLRNAQFGVLCSTNEGGCDESELSHNTIKGNGKGGFRCDDCSDNTFDGNNIRDNHGDGLNLQHDSDDNVIKNNKISRNAGDGIDLDQPGPAIGDTCGSDNKLINNRVTRNSQTGVENDCVDTDMEGNTVTNNGAIDLAGEGSCGEGNVDSFTGNNIGTGTTTTTSPNTGPEDPKDANCP